MDSLHEILEQHKLAFPGPNRGYRFMDALDEVLERRKAMAHALTPWLDRMVVVGMLRVSDRLRYEDYQEQRRQWLHKRAMQAAFARE